jgi:hypothetical protein
LRESETVADDPGDWPDGKRSGVVITVGAVNMHGLVRPFTEHACHIQHGSQKANVGWSVVDL